MQYSPKLKRVMAQIEKILKDNDVGGDHQGNRYYGAMAVDSTIQRLDAYPAVERKSVFMGETSFK